MYRRSMTRSGKDDGQALDRGGGAGRLGTSVRFVRRLIAERRIAYIKVGRHVRIAEADLAGFVAAGRIEASA
jgi:excisionase family DNA binding protein